MSSAWPFEGFSPACCVTAIFSKQAMFKFYDAFFIWMTPAVNHSHGRPVKVRNDNFQTLYALEVNFSAGLHRENNAITLFSFGTDIPVVDQSQYTFDVVMAIFRGADRRK